MFLSIAISKKKKIDDMYAGPQTYDHSSAKILTDLKKITGRSLGKFVAKWVLKILPHLAHVATLPRETLISSAKQTLDDKLQDSVAAYLRFGEVVNNQIKKGLLLSV